MNGCIKLFSFVFFLLFTNSTFAVNANAIEKVCTNAIKQQFHTLKNDQYGNSSGREIEYIAYQRTFEAGTHPYGKNNSNYFTFRYNMYRNGRISNTSYMSVYCVTDFSNQIVGIEISKN
jgi:hypothetical protein